MKKVCVASSHYSVAEQTKFLKILNREKCDLVHFTHFNLPLLYRGKFVVTIHDTTISFYPGKKMNSWWRKMAYNLVIRNAVQRAKKIITVSDNTANDLVKLFGVKREKMQTIWNGIGEEFREISEEEKKAVRKKYNLNDKFLLYTGNWREHKNLVGLLQAFRVILDSIAA
ncbi:glycosyltransferase, partial [Candidatus Gracilibacteria bacterium]|nr:glycosyltransferase [Candidatus Gracilibacteria bacterium]